MVVVGNTTMIHLFVGTDPTSIGMFPYEPQFVEEQNFGADKIGFRFNPNTRVRTLPLITGFIGADIVSATLAAELEHTQPGTMLVDVGTNGEIMFLGKQGLVATSCATCWWTSVQTAKLCFWENRDWWRLLAQPARHLRVLP
jgi:uncharacterized 2Fe-2S/4Fe-4S cluster protein (DUF4445 family)